MGATPAFGFTACLLALVVAREAGTTASKVLAGFATVGGIAYALAGPLVNLTDNVAVTPLFIGQAGVAVWLIGTAVRLARGGRDDESAESLSPEAATRWRRCAGRG